ncbi:hypothetical protein HDU93_005148 [Gonapodya sp. JEL0774]|nr:hypothetical protein HDU93_005148 [Gonapodya sp. JEL0774]
MAEIEFPFAESNQVSADIPDSNNEFAGVKVNLSPLDGTLFVAPFVPANPEVVEAAMDVAGVRGNDVVVDLGCGDGRVLIAALRRSVRRVLGVELDPQLVAIARSKIVQAGFGPGKGQGIGKAEIVEGDMFAFDIPPSATLVVLYLLPAGLEKLASMLGRWLTADRTPQPLVAKNQKVAEQEFEASDRTLAEDDGEAGVEMVGVGAGKRIVTIGYSIPGWTATKGVQHRLKSRVDTWLFTYTPDSVPA